MDKVRRKLKFIRCDSCGRLLTDSIIALGICAGHKMRVACEGNFMEWMLIKIGVWERINLWKAKREAKRYGF